MFGTWLTQNGLETNCYTRVSADQFLSFGVCGMDRNDFVNMVQGLNNEFCRMENEIYSNINLMIRFGLVFTAHRKNQSPCKRCHYDYSCVFYLIAVLLLSVLLLYILYL